MPKKTKSSKTQQPQPTFQPRKLSKDWTQIGPDIFVDLAAENNPQKAHYEQPVQRRVYCDQSKTEVIVISKRRSVGAPRAFIDTKEGRKPVGWTFVRPDIFIARVKADARQEQAGALYAAAMGLR